MVILCYSSQFVLVPASYYELFHKDPEASHFGIYSNFELNLMIVNNRLIAYC